MARSLSVDLRRRVVGAIEGGLSCRAAAQRFGVSASSAIQQVAGHGAALMAIVTPAGARAARPPLSHRIEAHDELIPFCRGFAKSDILRFRNCRTGLGSAVSPSLSARSGGSSSAESSRAKKWAHTAEQRRSTVNAARERWFEGQLDLDPTRIVFIDETAASEHQDGAPLRSCTQRRAMPRRRAPWPLENHHLHCRAALRRHRCAHGPRRPDERRGLSRLCRTGACSRVAASRPRHHGQSARS